MVVWAQVGNGPNVGILILLLRLFFDIFVFFCDVVDARLVLFTVRIDHRGSVTTTRVAFSLHVAFLFTVTAHNIGIVRTVAADWGSVGGRGPCGRGVEVVVVAGWLLTSDNSNLFDFVVGQFVPENGGGLSPVDENPGKYGIFFASSVEKRNVCKTSHTVMVVEGLSDVGHFYVGSGGEGLGVLFVERRLQG